jgi:hypothetical protein
MCWYMYAQRSDFKQQYRIRLRSLMRVHRRDHGAARTTETSTQSSASIARREHGLRAVGSRAQQARDVK